MIHPAATQVLPEHPRHGGRQHRSGPASRATWPEWTVSDISRAIRGTLEESFGRVRVRGELGRVTRPRSGHLYMDLKDEDAVLSAIAWRGTASGFSFRPEEGLEVIVTGKITAYSGQSRYQLIVDRMELAGTGAMLQAIEQLRRRLEAEGLFDSGRKRPRPVLPRIIGVITSPSGAVIRDILHRLRDRFPRHVLIWPAAVQGAACPREVVAAIEGFNACTPDGPVPRPDLLILARGGGSVEDLAGFSDESVVRAIAASEIPVISAIGHETDTTLADHAADLRAPTPTAAAELAVPVRVDLHARLAGPRRPLPAGLHGASRERANESPTRRLPPCLLLTAVLGPASQRLDIATTALASRPLHPDPPCDRPSPVRAAAILPAPAVFLEEHARRCTHAKLALAPALTRAHPSRRSPVATHPTATLPPLDTHPCGKCQTRRLRTAGSGISLCMPSLVWRKFWQPGAELWASAGEREPPGHPETGLRRGDRKVVGCSRRAKQLRAGMDLEIKFFDGRHRARAVGTDGPDATGRIGESCRAAAWPIVWLRIPARALYRWRP